MKKILKSPFMQFVMGCLISLVIRVLRLTSRVSYDGLVHLEGVKGPVIFAAWHGRLIMLPYMAKKPLHALISEHRDGRIIHHTAQCFGIRTVAGSSTRGGARALRDMLKIIKSGENLFITPDGPKGPCMEAKIGVMEVARMAGVPIIPVSFSATRKRQFGSWDKFNLPKLFSHIRVVYGVPIYVEKHLDADEKEKQLKGIQQQITSTQEKADTLCL